MIDESSADKFRGWVAPKLMPGASWTLVVASRHLSTVAKAWLTVEVSRLLAPSEALDGGVRPFFLGQKGSRRKGIHLMMVFLPKAWTTRVSFEMFASAVIGQQTSIPEGERDIVLSFDWTTRDRIATNMLNNYMTWLRTGVGVEVA